MARDRPKEFQHDAPLPGWLHLWRCWVNRFNVLLTALAALSFVQRRRQGHVGPSVCCLVCWPLWLPLSPLAGYFRLQALPLAYYAWPLTILVGYNVLISVMKRFYVRRYGWQ